MYSLCIFHVVSVPQLRQIINSSCRVVLWPQTSREPLLLLPLLLLFCLVFYGNNREEITSLIMTKIPSGFPFFFFFFFCFCFSCFLCVLREAPFPPPSSSPASPPLAFLATREPINWCQLAVKKHQTKHKQHAVTALFFSSTLPQQRVDFNGLLPHFAQWEPSFIHWLMIRFLFYYHF